MSIFLIANSGGYTQLKGDKYLSSNIFIKRLEYTRNQHLLESLLHKPLIVRLLRKLSSLISKGGDLRLVLTTKSSLLLNHH